LGDHQRRGVQLSIGPEHVLEEGGGRGASQERPGFVDDEVLLIVEMRARIVGDLVDERHEEDARHVLPLGHFAELVDAQETGLLGDRGGRRIRRRGRRSRTSRDRWRDRARRLAVLVELAEDVVDEHLAFAARSKARTIERDTRLRSFTRELALPLAAHLA
jgi:hypothetical protein